MAKSKRTKATSISTNVRNKVHKRDGHKCIFCGSTYGIQVMHYISRANGGLGIEENLADGCIQCHMKLDQSPQRKEMKEVFKKYLQSKYPNWNEETLRYKRYG